MTSKPKDKYELSQLMKELIKERGKSGDFNDIDTSSITDMSGLFQKSDFNGDISEWNVSNVTDMSGMFVCAKNFNQDISNWDVSNVKDMDMCFKGTPIDDKVKMWFPEFHI
jgi:surface protein